MRATRQWACLAGIVACQLLGCARSSAPAASPPVIRLVDLFDAKHVSGAVPPSSGAVRAEWRFGIAGPTSAEKGIAATRGWEAAVGVSGLAVRDGLLVGRSTDAVPLLRVERTTGLDSADTLHAIEVRLRVSGGTNVSVQTSAAASVDVKQMVEGVGRNPWPMSSPLQESKELQTYTFTPVQPLPASRIRHLLVRPTDVAGVDFAIESIRLILRAEHLATIPSGLGWQGLREVYRETLVARAPEILRFDVQLPERPWFDLVVGTVEERPITFRVSARRGDESESATDSLQVDYTVTTPYRWDIHPVDLSSLGRGLTTIELSLLSDTPGTLGFWGTPVIRSRGATALTSSAGAGASLGDAPQGVILIHADTLRRDHLEAYGYSRKTAPTIARMAAEGVLFKNAIAQAAWTKASTPSIMTSLYPSTVGVQHVNDRVPSSALTLAEAYRAAGYATFSTSSVSFTGQHSNLHQGFEELHENGSLGPPNTPFRIKTAREFVDRTLNWVSRHRDVPFFAFLHLMDPHSPYEPYPPYNGMWANPSRKEEHQRQVREVTKIIADPALRSRGLPARNEVIKAGFDPDAYIQQEIDWYDGSIRGMDAELGRLFERLKEMGIDQRTLVLLYSDHGEEFHDHGGMFHEHSVYGEMTNVPLIARWPGRVPAGRSVDENVQLIDIMPTLLDLSRLEAPKGLQGQSLLPFLRTESAGAAWKPRPAISEAESITPTPEPGRAFSMRAIVDGQWKLIHKRIRAAGAPEYELYDQVKDPLNKQDLAPQNPDVVARLAKALDGWRHMAQASRLKPDAETAKGLSAEELQRLRSLGYVR